MKNFTLSLFMLFVFLQVEAQVQVGYGNSTVNNMPISSCYTYSYSQQIYLASEVSVSGTISQLSFYYKSAANSGNNNSKNWSIYLGTTTKSNFTGNTDWEPYSSLTEVFVGDVVFPETEGWMTIDLDAPFVYDGINNLLVAVDENSLGASCTITFEGFTATNRGIYNRSTGSNPSPSNPPTATGRVSTIANIIFGGLVPPSAPLCTALSVPASAAENVSSSVINWPVALGSPSGYKLKVGTTIGGTDVLNNLEVGNVLSYDLGVLLPGTTYYVTVIPFNSIGDATGCIESTFITCGLNTSFYENFDSSPTGASAVFVDCWTKEGNGTIYVGTGSVLPVASAPNHLFMGANGTLSNPTAAYAITPAMSNLQAQTHRLKFKAYCTTTDKIIEVGYFIDPTDVSSFILLEDFDLPGTNATTSMEFIVMPENIPVNVTKLVFRNLALSGSANIYIDDVTWEVIPACGDVTNIKAETYNSTSAYLTWEGGSETAWQYVYAESSVTDVSTLLNTIVDVSTTAQINLTNLTPSTSYNIWIRSNCGNGDFGNWQQMPYLFSTTCAPILAFDENFDSYPTGTNNPLPDCWSKSSTTGYSYLSTGSSGANSAPNRLFFSALNPTSTTSVPTVALATLPPVSNLQAGTHRLKFRAYSNVAERAIEVGYFSSLGDPSSFILIESLTVTATSNTTAEELICIPTDVPEGIEVLVLRNQGDAYTGTTTFYIDDVIWEAIPSCFDITDSTVVNITSTTADLTWTPGQSETEWEYAYALDTITDPSTLTATAVANTPIGVLTDLSSNTTYNYWIRSNCGDGDFGNWSGVQTFTTKCASELTFSENFDSYAIGAFNPLPNCWEKSGSGTVYLTSGSTNPSSAPNRLYMSASSAGSSPTESFAIMPPVSNLQAGTHKLVFKSRSFGVNTFLEIGYMTDYADPGSFMSLTTLSLSKTSWTTFEFSPSVTDIPEGVTSLVFKNGGTTTGSATIYIDDVNWDVAPACPLVTNVTVESVTSSTASFSWSPGDLETTWEYVYAINTITDPSTLTPMPISGDPSAVLSELVSSTTYNLWVRATCGSTSGDWSGMMSFTTLCSSYSLPFVEDFTSFLPACWTTSSAGTVESGPSATSGGFWISDGFLNNGLDGAARVSMAGMNETSWLITPVLNVTEGDQYTFKFNYGITNTQNNDPMVMGTDDTLQVAMSSDGGVTWTEIQLFDATSGITNLSQLYDYSFTATSTTVKFAIIAKNGSFEDANNYSFYVDNVVAEAQLGNGNFENNLFMSFPNPVKSVLNINYSQNISNVTVFNLLGQQVIDIILNNNQVQVDMSALASGNYVVKVVTGDSVKTIKVIKE